MTRRQLQLQREADREQFRKLFRNADFPHLRDGGKWRVTVGPKKPEFTLDRLCEYGHKLRASGLSDNDILQMFVDLYWDAHNEMKLYRSEK
jgi:hypothetical protein